MPFLNMRIRSKTNSVPFFYRRPIMFAATTDQVDQNHGNLSASAELITEAGSANVRNSSAFYFPYNGQLT